MNKDQVKIIIKTYDSDASNYDSEDYFIIKSSGPKIYDVRICYVREFSEKYLLATLNRQVTNSTKGNKYPIPKNGTGLAMT